jgi:hypothetical protein
MKHPLFLEFIDKFSRGQRKKKKEKRSKNKTDSKKVKAALVFNYKLGYVHKRHKHPIVEQG